MKNMISRRNLVTSGVAATTIFATSGSLASAKCHLDHKKMGYRLGAQWVDPALDDAGRQLVASSKCPNCNTPIKPDGLSYGEHMWG